jgi:hypothetical protein
MPINAAFNLLIPNPDTSVFVHKATITNTAGAHTILDYPLTNGKPNALVFVTSNWNPGDVGGIYDNHPIGVYYFSGKWRILNQDVVTMPVTAAFNVFVPPAGAGVFVHTATAGNSSGNSTLINNIATNGRPSALLIVTPNWNPGGVGGTFDNHPIGVWYSGGKWRIFNQDLASMPVNAAFNVYVLNKLYLPLVFKNH